MSTTNRDIFYSAVICAALLVFQGAQGFLALRTKAQQQDVATETIERWRLSYQALASSTQQWESRYPSMRDVHDLYGLYRTIDLKRYGLATNTDELTLTRVEPVNHNDIPVGLVSVCMASGSAGGGSALKVSAQSYAALLGALRELAKRPDVFIGNIGIQGDRGDQSVPVALLGDFCLLLRQEAGA